MTDQPMALAGLVEQLALAQGEPAARERALVAAAGLFALLRQELQVGEVRLRLVDGGLLLDDRWPVPPSRASASLIDVMRRVGAGGLALRGALTPQDLAALLDRDEVSSLDVRAAGAPQACWIPVEQSNAAPAAHAESFAGVLGVVAEAFRTVSSGGALPLPSLVACVADLDRVAADPAATAWADLDLSRGDAEDPLNAVHATRVAVLSLLGARALTDDAALVRRIGLAALLHDVGRLFLPFEFITETPDLDCRQFPAQLEHPALGAEFLMAQPGIDPLAVAVAFGHHHSAIEGQPYPDCAHEHLPSRFTELIAIADRFEGLTSRRPHRAALTPAHAFRLLAATGGADSAALLRAFVEAVGLYPLGALIDLDSGDAARVLRQSQSAEAPVVRLLTQSGAATGATIDLGERGVERPRIVGFAKL